MPHDFLAAIDSIISASLEQFADELGTDVLSQLTGISAEDAGLTPRKGRQRQPRKQPGPVLVPNENHRRERRALRHENETHPKLIESHCPDCGLLIAATVRPELLVVLERRHKCPVYCRYESNGKAKDAAAGR